MRKNSTDKTFALRLRHHPIEEIALRGAENSSRLEGGARKARAEDRRPADRALPTQWPLRRSPERYAEKTAHRSRPPGHKPISGVAPTIAVSTRRLDRPSACPTAREALHWHAEMQPSPDPAQGAPSLGRAEATLERDGAVEPCKKDLRLFRIERGFLQLDKLIAAALEHDPLQPVRARCRRNARLPRARDRPDNPACGGQRRPIPGRGSALPRRPCARSRLETSLHLRNTALEIERAQFDAEFLDQELTEVRLHLIVARAAGEVVQKLASARISVKVFHNLCLKGSNREQ